MSFTTPFLQRSALLRRAVACDVGAGVASNSVSRQQRFHYPYQFPLCLAWALTPWKAQGMTLSKVVVKLSAACGKPGVLFVSLTRVRHPDCLLLEDDFPAFSVLRRQLANPSFADRQRWEQRMRVFFSRTVRRHMRDSKLFSEGRAGP